MPQTTAAVNADLRQILQRFSYGVNESLMADALRRTDVAAECWPHLWWVPEWLYAEDQSGGRQGVEVGTDFEKWTLVRRILSRRQLHEGNVRALVEPPPRACPVLS